MIIKRRRRFPEQREYVSKTKTDLLIGKLRRWAGIKLEKKILRDLEKQESYKLKDKVIKNSKGPTNPEVNKELDKIINERYKGQVIYDPQTESHAIKDLDELRKIKDIQNKDIPLKLKEAIKDKRNKSAIVVNNNSSSTRAHEGGHLENHYGNNKKKREISDKDSKVRSNFNAELDYSWPRTISEAFEDRNIGKIVVKEEKNASKNGLKLLKEAGADKKTVNKAKKTLKIAEKGYKNLAKNKFWASLRSGVQIPSRSKLTPSNTPNPEIYGFKSLKDGEKTALQFGNRKSTVYDKATKKKKK